MNTLCALMIGTSFTSCLEDDENEPYLPTEPDTYPTYILNEGLWGANNANITKFFANYQTENLTDEYLTQNGKQMGDVANALIEEENNLYVVLNGSKYAARLSPTIKEQARYTFPENEGAPRCIEVEGSYAYVTQWGGQVSKLNARDMTLAATFNGGDNLEGIIEEDGKLYVANAYKVDGSGNYLYNKEVLVIDSKTMTQTAAIPVVANPVNMYEIDDRIYVISQGNYADVQAALQEIDPKTGTSKVILNDVDKITEGHNGLIYGVCSTYDSNWQLTNSFFTYNPNTGNIDKTSFLQDAPSSFSTAAIYLLEVDENTGFIYVGTSDYVNSGTIYQFDSAGKLIQSFDSGGINPSAMIFID